MTTSQPRETDKIAAERDALRDEVERLRTACSRENDTISQVLGRALGYPRFADDQKNFPGATDADGVCVGDHVAASLADEAANVIRTLRSEIEQLRADLNAAHSVINECAKALSEELAAWNIDPPIAHVQRTLAKCNEWLERRTPTKESK